MRERSPRRRLAVGVYQCAKRPGGRSARLGGHVGDGFVILPHEVGRSIDAMDPPARPASLRADVPDGFTVPRRLFPKVRRAGFQGVAFFSNRLR